MSPLGASGLPLTLKLCLMMRCAVFPRCLIYRSSSIAWRRDRSNDQYKPLENQVAVIVIEEEAAAVKVACNANASDFEALLSRYPDECNHDEKCLNHKGVSPIAGLPVTANKGENKVSHFLPGLVFRISDCVVKCISRARDFVN